MKIRQGFVSNSSSSSFVVKIKGFFHTDNLLNNLTPLQTQKLLDYGFVFSSCLHPSHLEHGFLYDKNKVLPNDANSLIYSVVCNQDDIIKFLIENKISFSACCHYGHEHIFYCNKDDYVIKAYNYGTYMETYGAYNDLNTEAIKVGYHKIPIEDFLNED